MAMLKNLYVVDWVVVGLVIVISIAIAVINFFISRRKRAQVDEFLMGSHQVPVLPAAVSLMASFISSITLIGYPAQVFLTGSTFFFVPMGYMIGGVIIVTVIIPLIFPLRLNTIYEYLELRYQTTTVRRVGAIAGIFCQVCYMGLCIFGPSVALDTMVGFSTWKGILLVGILGTVPTVVGGLKGVIWMDFFQAIIMCAALVAIIVSGAASLGGMGEAVAIFRRHSPPLQLEASFTKVTVVSALVGPCVEWVGFLSLTQAAFQRYGAVATITHSRLVMVLGLGVQAAVLVAAICASIVVYAFYAGRGCDPLTSGHISNINGLVPDLVERVLAYPGVPGLFVGAVFSASYSTVTSCLAGIAANLWEDILKTTRLGQKSSTVQLAVIRGVCVVTGMAGMAVAYACEFIGGTMFELSYIFLSSALAPLIGVYVLSAAFPMANAAGALSGAGVSFLLLLWMGIGRTLHVPSGQQKPSLANVTCPLYDETTSTITDISTTAGYRIVSATTAAAVPVPSSDPLMPLYSVHSIWYIVIGTLTVVVVGLVVSFATRRCCTPAKRPERKLFFNFVQGCMGTDDTKTSELKCHYTPQPSDESKASSKI